MPCSNPHTRACLFFAAPNFTYAWQIVVLSTFKQAVWICKNCLPDWNQINKCLIMAFKRSKITREIIKNLIQKVASKNWNYCKFEQKINYIRDGFLSCAIQYLVLNVKLVLHCDNQLDLFEYMKMYRIGQRWKGNQMTNFAMGHGEFNETCSQFKLVQYPSWSECTKASRRHQHTE